MENPISRQIQNILDRQEDVIHSLSIVFAGIDSDKCGKNINMAKAMIDSLQNRLCDLESELTD